MRSDGMSARRPRPLGTRQEGDSPGHGDCRSSFLEPPAQSFLRARDHKIGKGPWKLPEPWTPRTRPPLLGKPADRFSTATTGSVFLLW
jgi:hypothetical protein